jgi:hypothetical protein
MADFGFIYLLHIIFIVSIILVIREIIDIVKSCLYLVKYSRLSEAKMKHWWIRNSFLFVLIFVLMVSTGLSISPTVQVHAATYIPMVSAGHWHTLGLKSNGTVIATGYNLAGQCDVGLWTDIVEVSAGGAHSVGLKSDGTVVAVGANDVGQSDVASWTNIIHIAAGRTQTVGLRSDGSVVATGGNVYGECNVGSWTGIKQISAGEYSTVGIRSDDSVVSTALGSLWSPVTDISAGWRPSMATAIKSDGTFASTYYGLVGTDFVQSAGGYLHVVGLEFGGTVLTEGDNSHDQRNTSTWTNIVQITTGYWTTVGLRSDGTVLATGWSEHGECDVSSWRLLNQAPTAEAGSNQKIAQTDPDATEITLDGSGSTDDGLFDNLTYTWTWAGGTANGEKPVIFLKKGMTTVTLNVTDGQFSDEDTVDITVYTPQGVGGEIEPINKSLVIISWVIVAFIVIIFGVIILKWLTADRGLE